ncbi:MAG: hypothetical protein PHQ98_01245 [Candidatus ainarchaeum sp.]|nr:hypothetical protein [Candidatus ainarchaeum sp.]
MIVILLFGGDFITVSTISNLKKPKLRNLKLSAKDNAFARATIIAQRVGVPVSEVLKERKNMFDQARGLRKARVGEGVIILSNNGVVATNILEKGQGKKFARALVKSNKYK